MHHIDSYLLATENQQKKIIDKQVTIWDINEDTIENIKWAQTTAEER